MNTSKKMVILAEGLALRAKYMDIPNSKALDTSVPAVKAWFEWQTSVPDKWEEWVMETHDKLFDQVLGLGA